MNEAEPSWLASRRAPDTFSGALAVYLRQPGVCVILVFVLGVAGWRLALGEWSVRDLAGFALAIAVWPVMEWLLHRHVLHARPWQLGRWRIDPDPAVKHRAHHAEPWRVRLVFLPVYVPVMLAPMLVLAVPLLPDRAVALSFLTGFGLAALNYEWTHWIVHTRIQPRSAYYQAVFRNHRLHHFRHEDYWFSFMLPALDRWLGTGPDAASVAPSGTARDLDKRGGRGLSS